MNPRAPVLVALSFLLASPIGACATADPGAAPGRVHPSLLKAGASSDSAAPRDASSLSSQPNATSSAASVAVSPPPLDSVAADVAAPCPPEMAFVTARHAGFCVDRFEAQLVEVFSDGTRRPHAPSERPLADHDYVATSRAGVFPQAFVSRVDSARACDRAGKRLCSRAEWQAACRKDGRAVYPYGNTHVDGLCNTGKAHLLLRLFPDYAYHWDYEAHFNAAALALEPGFLARTGQYESCASELGVHDMVGNLHEWVSDGVTRAFLESFAAEGRRQWQPATPGNGMFMGGFFSTSNEHGAGCNFTTVAHDAAYHDYSTGFRCCAATR